MVDRQFRRRRDSEPGGFLEIYAQRNDVPAAVMMMVIHRATITVVVIFLRLMLVLAARIAGFVTFYGRFAMGTKDAGIQASEKADC